MSAVFSGNTTPCNDFDINASELNRALADVEILNNGQLTLTKIDGTTFFNNIPFFPDFVISGINLSIDVSPNADDLLYTSGTYQINAVVYTLGVGGTINLTAGHPTDPRVDIVYLDTSSNINYLVGTPSPTPVPPTPPANTLVIAQIGVQPNANNLGGYTLTQVNINENNVSNGFLNNQTIRWDTTLNKWVPNSNLLSSTTQVSIGTAPTGNALFEVDGDIQINNIAAPFPTTNKLYAIGGDVYQDGVQLNGSGASIAPGTVNGSHLYQNGLNWVEDITQLFVGGVHDFNTNFFNINETDFNLNTRNAQNNFNISSFRNGNQNHYFRLIDFLGGGVKNTFPGLEYFITGPTTNESYLFINEYGSSIKVEDTTTGNYSEINNTTTSYNILQEFISVVQINEFVMGNTIQLIRGEGGTGTDDVSSLLMDIDFCSINHNNNLNSKYTGTEQYATATDAYIFMRSLAANNTSIKISSEESGVTTNTITLVADNNIFLDGPINLNKQNVNAAGTTIITKNIVFITADVAGIVLDLGSTLISPIGRQVIIKRDHATNVNSVQVTSSIIGHTIEGAASYNITGVRESITLVYNDTTNNWNII